MCRNRFCCRHPGTGGFACFLAPRSQKWRRRDSRAGYEGITTFAMGAIVVVGLPVEPEVSSMGPVSDARESGEAQEARTAFKILPGVPHTSMITF